jgi:PKHD-type hydroxylase
VNLKHNYWYFASAIPPHICDQITELGLTQMMERKHKYGDDAIMGSVGDWRQKTKGVDLIPSNHETVESLKAKGIEEKTTYVRDSDVTFIDAPWLYDIIWPFIRTANKNAGWNFDWNYTEEMQFTKYGVNQFYGWHTDSSHEPFEKFDPSVDPIHKNLDGTPFLDQSGQPMPENHNKTSNPNMIGKIRKISVTVSLNDPDEYEGGNLQFDFGPHKVDRYYTCTEIRPKGSVIVFPSHIYHQVSPVTKGTRYSLVCWSLGAAFR